MLLRIRGKRPEEIRRYQLKRVKDVVSYAYEHSQFYRNYYELSGFHPSMIREYEDIHTIPIVKRAMLKSAPSESVLTRKDTARLRCHTTTGSSGTPVSFYFNRKEELQKNLGFLRAYFLMGVKPSDITVALRDPIDIRQTAPYERLGLFRYDYHNIYNGMDIIYENLATRYESIDVLKGMPSDLVNLAYKVKNGKMRFPSVGKVISDCEVLDDFSRSYIEETFAARVLDTYACVEAGCVAFQIPGSSKYFINEDQVLLESVDGSRLAGDAIVTNLRNVTFPIIRYQIGDVVEFGDGKSDLEGIGLRTIDRIHGKYLDFIVLPDGSLVSPHVPKQELTHNLPGIRKFQVVQTALDSVTVYIEPDEGYSEDTGAEAVRRLGAAFKGQIACSVMIDEHLSEKSSRKFKCIDSRIAQDFLSENAV